MTALRRLASKIRKTAEPGSSVGAVSDYGLDDRAIGVPSPAEAKDFFSNLFVQTGSGAHPASCTTGTGGAFPGTKRGRGVTLTTHRHLVLRSRMSRSCTSSPSSATMACSGTALLLQNLHTVPPALRHVTRCLALSGIIYWFASCLT
jgi:hypothetical protein